MIREVSINQNKLAYTIRRSKRARYMRLSVRRDLTVTVTLPWRSSENEAICFLQERFDWVLGKLEYFKNRKSPIPEPSRSDYLAHKEAAREIVEKKLAYYNQSYGFKWKSICIRNPVSRWGSCSDKGRLNFSYRLVFLPEKLQDYIIVHELCHLGEFNHGVNFWRLMNRTIPDAEKRRQIIRSL